MDAKPDRTQADPTDFKKVHSVGETGGSILPDPPGAGGTASKPSASKPSASKPSASKPAASRPAAGEPSAGDSLQAKLGEVREKLKLDK